MATFGRTEVLLAILSLLALSLLAGMVLASGWVLYRLLNRRPILPMCPLVARRPVRWNLGTVLLVLVVYPVVSCEMPRAYDLATGRKPVKPTAAADAVAPRNRNQHAATKKPLTGNPSAVSARSPAKELPAGGGPGPSEIRPRPAVGKERTAPASRLKPAGRETGYSMTEMMAILAMVNVVLVIVVPLLVKLTSGATLRDIGLSFAVWWRQAAVGIVAALAAAPFIYSIQFISLRIWENNAHPLQKMLRDEFSPGVPELAILSGVILAPIFEELLFRGILQTWLVGLFERRRAVPAPRPEDTAAENTDPRSTGESSDSEFDFWEADSPEGLPCQSAANSKSAVFSGKARAASRGIVLTSLVFALIHATQWPAPIALFPLALVIGAVYQRTGSLIAAICLHATFNGLSTLAMFMMLLTGPNVDANKAKMSRMETASIENQVNCGGGWMHPSP
jgi:membrane protease YdiL (CAAX protease family)